MSIYSSKEYDQHERVQFCRHPESGLSAIIAIHSTVLGPAAGGCRMWSYATEQEAIDDVLRLSKGMTYKNAMADLPLGGGKAVIIGDPEKDKSRALLSSFAAAVNFFGGDYVTAEDVGIGLKDMEILASRTPFVAGLPRNGNRAGGDPSPMTAYGVFLGITAALIESQRITEPADLDGISVAVQGTGAVGYHLCGLLHGAGASLIVSDVNAERVERVSAEFDAQPVAPDQVLYKEVDVVSPCALGGIINASTAPRIRAPVIAGAANNQLATELDGDTLTERGILYIPDYVVNAGGIINVAYEYLGLGNEEAVKARIGEIGPRIHEIIRESHAVGLPPHRIADAMARARILSKRSCQAMRITNETEHGTDELSQY